MTQIENILTVLQGIALVALYWGGPLAALALTFWLRKRSQVRYHVGNPRAGVAVQTFRTKAAARKASVALYKAHGRCFRITRTH